MTPPGIRPFLSIIAILLVLYNVRFELLLTLFCFHIASFPRNKGNHGELPYIVSKERKKEHRPFLLSIIVFTYRLTQFDDIRFVSFCFVSFRFVSFRHASLPHDLPVNLATR